MQLHRETLLGYQPLKSEDNVSIPESKCIALIILIIIYQRFGNSTVPAPPFCILITNPSRDHLPPKRSATSQSTKPSESLGRSGIYYLPNFTAGCKLFKPSQEVGDGGGDGTAHPAQTSRYHRRKFRAIWAGEASNGLVGHFAYSLLCCRLCNLQKMAFGISAVAGDWPNRGWQTL